MLTVHGVDGHGGSAAGQTPGDEGHVEGGGALSTPLAQLVQVGEQWEVDNGERNVPVRKEPGEHEMEISREGASVNVVYCCVDL